MAEHRENCWTEKKNKEIREICKITGSTEGYTEDEMKRVWTILPSEVDNCLLLKNT